MDQNVNENGKMKSILGDFVQCFSQYMASPNFHIILFTLQYEADWHNFYACQSILWILN